MRRGSRSGLLTAAAVGVSVVGYAQAPAAKDLLWAFPVASSVVNKAPAPAIEGPQQIKGSSKRYTQEQLDLMSIAVDWFPEGHTPMPEIVKDGSRDGGFACGSCHLANGMGHPESSELAGLPEAYFIKTMHEFRSGQRKDPIRMTGIAQALSEDDMRQAARWFARLKPVPGWTRVVEAATVPKTYLGQGRMRFVDPEGGTEPIGPRIITIPQDVVRARARDPRSGFIAYVPPGSLARGKALALGDSGKFVACSACHGPTLKGAGAVPGIAGKHPIYLVRQFYNFQTGARAGPDAQLMKPVVANLSDSDMVAVAAYVASLRP